MTREEKIKVLAELDGWTQIKDEVLGSGGPGRTPSPHGVPHGKNYRAICKSYLTSYDAIIPLIQKQSRATLVRVVLSFKGQNDVSRMVDWLQYTPEQLADALIKAVGKWRE